MFMNWYLIFLCVYLWNLSYLIPMVMYLLIELGYHHWRLAVKGPEV